MVHKYISLCTAGNEGFLSYMEKDQYIEVLPGISHVFTVLYIK
jgi:hypothetical protein